MRVFFCSRDSQLQQQPPPPPPPPPPHVRRAAALAAARLDGQRGRSAQRIRGEQRAAALSEHRAALISAAVAAAGLRAAAGLHKAANARCRDPRQSRRFCGTSTSSAKAQGSRANALHQPSARFADGGDRSVDRARLQASLICSPMLARSTTLRRSRPPISTIQSRTRKRHTTSSSASEQKRELRNSARIPPPVCRFGVEIASLVRDVSFEDKNVSRERRRQLMIERAASMSPKVSLGVMLAANNEPL